jgi:hypothetical protein
LGHPPGAGAGVCGVLMCGCAGDCRHSTSTNIPALSNCHSEERSDEESAFPSNCHSEERSDEESTFPSNCHSEERSDEESAFPSNCHSEERSDEESAFPSNCHSEERSDEESAVGMNREQQIPRPFSALRSLRTAWNDKGESHLNPHKKIRTNQAQWRSSCLRADGQ